MRDVEGEDTGLNGMADGRDGQQEQKGTIARKRGRS